jgi:hypothetical protein
VRKSKSVFEDFEVKGKGKFKNWTLEWEYIGEGTCGEYDPKDNEDIPLLRANLYYKNRECEDGSYCTLAPISTPKAGLIKAAHELFEKLEKPDLRALNKFGVEQLPFNDRAMQLWTWRKYPQNEKVSPPL